MSKLAIAREVAWSLGDSLTELTNFFSPPVSLYDKWMISFYFNFTLSVLLGSKCDIYYVDNLLLEKYLQKHPDMNNL